MSYDFQHIDKNLREIYSNTARCVDDIQNYATSRVNNEKVQEYENELSQRISNLKTSVNDQLDTLHQNIICKRPSPNDTNYKQKHEQYRAFLAHANDGMKSLKSIFSRLFSKLFEVLKQIVKWIVDHLPGIIVAIAYVFGNIIAPFFGLF